MQLLSEHELQLIHALQIAPRVPWSQAAQILDAHPAVLSQRWEKLRSRGIAWIAAQPLGRLRQQVLCFAELACPPRLHPQVTASLVSMPSVFSIDLMSRNSNLALTITGQDMDDMVYGTFDQLASLPGVESMHSSFAVQMHLSARDWRLRALDRQQISALTAINADQTRTDASLVLREEHRSILALLQQDGRCTAAEVARATGLPPASARRQLAKVLHSETVTLRCDMAQGFSGYPVAVQWYARVPATAHEQAARTLASTPNMRMVCSVTGHANMMIAMWLASVNDILEAEKMLQAAVPGIELSDSTLLLRSAKRLGWMVGPDSRTNGRQIAPLIPIH